MGMGGLVKTGDKAAAADSKGETSGASRPVLPSWATGGFGRSTVGESSAQKTRKKSVVEEQEEEDDRHIRFTIGGVGKRMTKEDFISEMRKLDQGTRREVVDHSSASNVVKTLAKQDVQPRPGSSHGKSAGDTTGGTSAKKSLQTDGQTEDTSPSETERPSGSSSRTPSSEGSPRGAGSLSSESPETAVERRRRLAVLKGVGDEGEDTGETAAERRRREAALGMSSRAGGEDDDSDDDDTLRVPPPRRGIRFADDPAAKDRK